jgi:ABC-type polysaccharide/polyol phosphate export permease
MTRAAADGGAVRQLVARRDLFVTLVQRQLWLRVKRSWMSTWWPVLTPFILAFLYVYVFHRVLRVPIEDYPVFVLCGLVPWTFLVQTVNRGMASISTEPEMVRRAPFPYALLPLSSAAAQAVNLALSVLLLTGFVAFEGDVRWALLPALLPVIVALFLFAATVSLLLAVTDVYNQDIRWFVPQILSMWLFVLPILYLPSMAPQQMRALRFVDPMYMVADGFRSVFYEHQLPAAAELGRLLVITVVLFVTALTVFNRLAVDLAKDV